MEPMDDCLVGIRLRDTAQADDYRVAGDLELHVGALVLVETSAESTIGEVRRPRREIPEAKKDRLYRRVLRLATEAEARAYRERRRREELAIETAQQVARARGLALKVVDVEMHPVARRATVYFSAEERIDFRDLVRDLARELHSRGEMRQIGARDTTRLLDGIGPCGRQLCSSPPPRTRTSGGGRARAPGAPPRGPSRAPPRAAASSAPPPPSGPSSRSR